MAILFTKMYFKEEFNILYIYGDFLKKKKKKKNLDMYNVKNKYVLSKMYYWLVRYPCLHLIYPRAILAAMFVEIWLKSQLRFFTVVKWLSYSKYCSTLLDITHSQIGLYIKIVVHRERWLELAACLKGAWQHPRGGKWN